MSYTMNCLQLVIGVVICIKNEHYGILAEKCEVGRKQSPIDIEIKNTRYQNYAPFHLCGHNRLSFKDGSLYAENTGSTIKVKPTSSARKAFLDGGPLNVKYEFAEMHFHWGDVMAGDINTGSEHKIDGKSFPMELHMVHRNVHDKSISEAATHENGLTVLGFKFQIVNNDNPVHPAMTTLAYLTDFIKQSGNQVNITDLKTRWDLSVMNFLPVQMDEYFHYKGSLTTGGCEEAVNWVVFRKPLAVRIDHLRQLQTLLGNDGVPILNNFRETQPRNDRPVYYRGKELLEDKESNGDSSEGNEDKTWSTDTTLNLLCHLEGSPQPAVMAEKRDRILSEKLQKNAWKQCASYTKKSEETAAWETKEVGDKFIPVWFPRHERRNNFNVKMSMEWN